MQASGLFNNAHVIVSNKAGTFEVRTSRTFQNLCGFEEVNLFLPSSKTGAECPSLKAH